MALCKVRYSGQRIAQMPCVRSTVALTSCGSHKAHPQMDAANNQDALFCFDLARHIGSKLSVAGIDLARFQRSPKGTHHSTGGCRNHIVDGRGVRFPQFCWFDFAVLGDGPVDTVYDRLSLAGEISNAERPFTAFNPGLRNINYITHGHSFQLPSVQQLTASASLGI